MGVFAPTEPCERARLPPPRGREVAGALCARPSGAGSVGPSDTGLSGRGTALWAEERGEVRDGGRAEEGASVGEDAAPPVDRGRERSEAQAAVGWERGLQRLKTQVDACGCAVAT